MKNAAKQLTVTVAIDNFRCMREKNKDRKQEPKKVEIVISVDWQASFRPAGRQAAGKFALVHECCQQPVEWENIACEPISLKPRIFNAEKPKLWTAFIGTGMPFRSRSEGLATMSGIDETQKDPDLIRKFGDWHNCMSLTRALRK